MDDDLELARLRSLRSYDVGSPDDPVDPDLDLATRLLCHVTGASAAAVNLVDRTLLLPVATTGSPREACQQEQSLCAVAMRAAPPGTVFQTRDAPSDPRFGAAALANVTGRVGFYAAAPLRDPEGLPLGTVCAWDGPGGDRQCLDAGQTQALLDLADFVMRVLALRRRAGEMEHHALHDPLTGLPNRRLLLDRLDQALARRERLAGEPLVVMIDLVGFKAVNDVHGHGAGDAVLVAVAERLQRLLRPEDTVSRWGGDEFVVIAERMTSPFVEPLLDRLRRAFDEPLETSVGLAVQVGITTGSALSTGQESAEVLIERADTAMYDHRRRERA